MNNKEKNFVSAVVYLYNEGSNIQSHLRGLEETLNQNFEKYEIIVVNDGSSDNSAQLVKSYVSSQESAKVTLMNMGYHQGLETSMDAGVDLAIGDFVFEMESADADYNWSVLMEVYHHSLEGFDVVNARGKISTNFTFGSLFYYFMNHYANLQYPLASGSFRIVSRRAINRIHSLANRIPYRKVAYSNCGLKCDTILYDCIKSKKSKRYSNRLELATNSLVLFTDIAFRFSFWFAVLMFVLTIGMAIYIVASLVDSRLVSDWAMVVFSLNFVSTGFLAILCMVIRYLSTLVRLNFLKRDYVFETIDKLQK